MTPRSYLFGILFIAFLGWASWSVVILKLSPFTAGALALGLFYASLFVALTGTLTLVNYYVREKLAETPGAEGSINTALRQGMLLSFMICIALSFQRLKVLTWWDALLLLVIVLLIEFYFMSRES